MMNALFGVLGAAACRFFDPAIANAITGFGQQTLRWTRDAFEAAGVRVLYGDTDSVFVQLGARRPGRRRDAARARRGGDRGARSAREYGVASRLELELERVFERLFLPRVRGGAQREQEALRRLAAAGDAPLVVVGLESVRRDWPRRRAPPPAGHARARCSPARTCCRSCARSSRRCARRARRRARLREAHPQGRRSSATPAQRRRTSRPRARRAARRRRDPLRDHRERARAGAARPPAAARHRPRATTSSKRAAPGRRRDPRDARHELRRGARASRASSRCSSAAPSENAGMAMRYDPSP